MPNAYLARFKWIEDPRRRSMSAMVSFLDDSVGRVVDELKRLGMMSETLLVFHSDNGGEIMGAGLCGNEAARP